MNHPSAVTSPFARKSRRNRSTIVAMACME